MGKYVPLTMWGSYLGFVIGFLITYYFNVFNYPDKLMIDIISTSYLFGTIGFLIGWGIHSLVRAYK